MDELMQCKNGTHLAAFLTWIGIDGKEDDGPRPGA
jgi:hypothetical protein